MLATQSSRMLRPRGFSLLELTLVLVILGIMMAGAALYLTGFAERAKIKTTKTRMETIKQAIETYRLTSNANPPDLQTLVTAKILDPSKPITDSWDRQLNYSPSGTSDRPYELWSQGPSEEVETDDIDVWTMNLQPGE